MVSLSSWRYSGDERSEELAVNSTTTTNTTTTTTTTTATTRTSTFVEMAPSSSSFPDILQFGHGSNPLPSWTAQPSEKWFRVVGSHDGIKVQRHDVLCTKEGIAGYFQKVANKFKVKSKDLKKMQLKYYIKVRGHEAPEEHVITLDDDLVPTMKLCYCLCTEFYEIQMHLVSDKTPSRKKRKVEETGIKMKGHVVVDQKYYEAMTAKTAETYLKRVAYMQYIMGIEDEKVNNLINPTTFICQVKHCKQVLKLDCSGNLSLVFSHWKTHYGGVNAVASCETLVRRKNHVVKEKGALGWKKIYFFKDEDLEDISDEGGFSLAVKESLKEEFLVDPQKKFNGSSLMVQMDIVKKIAVSNQFNASDLNNPQRGIETYFTTSSV